MPTILVIDDDPHIHVILTRIFRRHGFTVLLALDGPGGIQQAIEHEPDLILLDIVMPGMDGVETARRLREEPCCDDIPILFLTAFAPAVGRHEAKAVAVDGFISKPFDVKDLVEKVQAFIGEAKEDNANK